MADANKGVSFGEISKLVSDKWKTLTDKEKLQYEEKANIINSEKAQKLKEQKKMEKGKKMLEKKQTAELANKAAIAQTVRLQLPESEPATSSQMGVASILPASQNIPKLSELPMQNEPEPIFHKIKPRPQRLLHSEAYIKYVEGLTTEANPNAMSNWQHQLNASKKIVKCSNENQLPVHWLANKSGDKSDLDALWALRDFLMCDSLGVTKIVNEFL